MIDASSLFGRAEQSFAAGRLDAARADLLQVQRLAGAHPAVLHLLGLVEKKRGDLPNALPALAEAARLDPRNPQIANNLGNLLGELGRADEALASYDRAIRLKPDWLEPRLNRAIALHRSKRFGAATDAFAALEARAALSARYWSARGALDLDRGAFDAAAASFDRALALSPAHQVAHEGRARVALHRAEPDCSDRLRALVSEQPANRKYALLLSEALEIEGDADAERPLAEAVAAQPEWGEGHDRLAQMRGEAGDPDSARSFRAALALLPGDSSLWLKYLEALATAQRFWDALSEIDTARSRLGAHPELDLIEAFCADEGGFADRAADIFARTSDRAGAAWSRLHARHALRVDDPAHAAALLEPLATGPEAIVSDWAHLSFAWRLTGDPRQQWLLHQPNLWAVQELAIGAEELTALAQTLRGLHTTRSHPIGQSLRGGTQTRGRLFARDLPILRLLHLRLSEAVERYRAALPDHDASHPLLRYRYAALTIKGSWSVRLASSGFHVHHIHPQGVLSSAFYVALPDAVCGEGRQGWLELGAAPTELGLDLPPLDTIEPKVGRLALFPSYLFHGTRPFDTGERLTVAFDVVSDTLS